MSEAAAKSQVAALPWRDGAALEVMLVSSRETRRWVIPKGWPMKGKTPSGAAEREALEEAGLKGVIEKQPLGNYHYIKRKKNGSAQLCSVAVYPMQVTRQLKNWPEKSQRTTKWWPIREAASAVHEPELQDIIREFGVAMNVPKPDAETK